MSNHRLLQWARNCAMAVSVLAGMACVSCARDQRPLTVVTTPEPRQVTVVGEAEVRVAPDEVLITVGVETGDNTLAAAKARNDDAIRRMHAAAAAAGVEPKHIQTEYIEIDPRYQDPYQRKVISGFVVRRTSMLTVRNIPRFESILAAVIEAGSTEVLGVQFRTTELRKHKDQARALAIKAAEEKAAALAKQLGQEIHRPRLIQEEHDGWFSPFGSWWGARMGAGMSQNVVQNVMPSAGAQSKSADALAPGQISIQARVRVSFELD